MENYIKYLVEKFDTKRIFLELALLRYNHISAALNSDLFKNAYLDGEMASSHDTFKIGSDGSMCLEDLVFLYLVVADKKPATIFEVGTWFGASTIVMAKAAEDFGFKTKIITVDNNQVYDNKLDNVKVVFGKSWDVWKLYKNKKFDFVYYDAVVFDADVPYIIKSKFFGTHDYTANIPHNKGVLNINKIGKYGKPVLPHPHRNRPGVLNRSVGLVLFE